MSAGALAVASLIGDPPARDGTAEIGLREVVPEPETETGVTPEVGTAPDATPDTGREPADAPEMPSEEGYPAREAEAERAEADIVVSGRATVETLPDAPTGPPVSSSTPLPEVPQEPEAVEAFDMPDTGPGNDDAPFEIAGMAPPVEAEAPSEPVLSPPQTEAPQVPSGSAPQDPLPTTPRADVPAGRGAAPLADTAPESRPEAGDAVSAPETLPETAAGPSVAPGSEEPVLPGPPSRVIEVPAGEADITVATDPPPPPSQAPREVIDEEPETPEPDAADEVETAGLPQTAAPGSGSGALPEPPAPPEAPAAAGEAPAGIALEPGTITVLPVPELGERGLPGRAAGLNGGDAVPVRRPGTEEEAEPAPIAEDAPAILRFAAPDTADAGAPRLSVVMLDMGLLDDPVSAVSSIPFPVTIGIDPEAPNAAARAARWRDAGYEVAAMVRLPAGARPSDVEVTYEAAFAALPEAVALLDAGGAGLNADGDVTAQALDHLAKEGRGLVALPHGLATPLRQARDRGVPAVEIYRDLGEVGQDDRVIRRFLDQAAFRARLQGQVTLLAELNPETITALTLWGNRAGREGVSPAPVSALLRLQSVGPGK